MEPIFWIAMLSNAATLGIAAAVFIPLSRAAARRLSVPRADAERVEALEAELVLATARINEAEDRLVFLERLLENGSDAARLEGSRSGVSTGE
jgi:hypothetical protein